MLCPRFDAHLSEKGVKEAESGGQALKEAGYKFLVGNPVYLADFLTVEIYYLRNMPKSNIKANVSSNLKLRATVVIKLHDQLMHISH